MSEGFDFEINPVNHRKMFTRIFVAEQNNLKTDNKGDKEMRQKIIDIIESEADKCY